MKVMESSIVNDRIFNGTRWGSNFEYFEWSKPGIQHNIPFYIPFYYKHIITTAVYTMTTINPFSRVIITEWKYKYIVEANVLPATISSKIYLCT